MFGGLTRQVSAAAFATVVAFCSSAGAKAAEADGVVKVKSAYSMSETIARLR